MATTTCWWLEMKTTTAVFLMSLCHEILRISFQFYIFSRKGEEYHHHHDVNDDKRKHFLFEIAC